MARVHRPSRRALGALLLAGAGGLLALTVLVAPGPGLASSEPGSVRYAVVPEASEARYRVREQLAGLSFPNDAVGVTSAVDGQIVLNVGGRVLARASRVSVDVRTLRSDEPRRDRYVRRNTLETDRYPAVVFVPTELRGLRAPLPAAGTVSFELVGDLTVREATRRTAWDATATLEGRDARVRARTAFRFADFGLRVPRVAVVLSVDEVIHLEADLLLRRSP
ncbi:MAG: YceI family protein [Candidatus Rokuibacteriota bacterium]